MRKLAATFSLSVGLAATVPALAQDPFTPVGPPEPRTSAPADVDPFEALPTAAPTEDAEPEPPAPPAPVAAEEPGAELGAEPVFVSDVPRPTSRVVAASPVESAPASPVFASQTIAAPMTAAPIVPMPPAQTEPPVPFGRFVPVYEPDAPRTAAVEPVSASPSSSLPPADYVLPPRTARQPHPADVIDPQARELIRQRELAVARQRMARIQYRKWRGISLLRPDVANPTSRLAAPATPVQAIHFRSR